MIVSAKGLKLRNIGQLIEFVHNGTAVMGRLENVMIPLDTKSVALRVTGCGKTFSLDGEHLVNIMRTAEAYEAFQGTLALEDLLSIRKESVV